MIPSHLRAERKKNVQCTFLANEPVCRVGIPNRNFSNPEYRYGFQGQEKDDEIKGSGNSLNYTFRMHDPRVGRFFAVDPLTAKYPHNSPYAFSENRVIDGVELEGLEHRNIVISHVLYNPMDETYSSIQTSEKLYMNVYENSGIINNYIYVLHDKNGNQFAIVDQTNYVRHVRSKVTREINIKGEVIMDRTSVDTPSWLGEGTMWSNQDKAIKYDEDSPKSTAKNHVWDVDMDELNVVMEIGRPSAFDNTQYKVYKKDKDLLTNIYRVTIKGKEISEAAANLNDRVNEFEVSSNRVDTYSLEYW